MNEPSNNNSEQVFTRRVESVARRLTAALDDLNLALADRDRDQPGRSNPSSNERSNR